MKRWVDFIVGVPLIKIFSFLPSFAHKGDEIKRKKNILVIKLAAVGDTVLLIPVLRGLRQQLPDANIDFLVSSINVSLAKTIPFINQLLIMDLSLISLLKLTYKLRRNHYDIVIDAEQWSRATALIAFFVGAPVRFGFDAPGQYRQALFTHTVKKTFGQHEIDDFYGLFSLVVTLPRNYKLELWETERGQQEIGHFFQTKLGQNKIKVLVHPGCGGDGRPREWSLENYASLVNWLRNKWPVEIFLTGGPEETEKTRRLNRFISRLGQDLGGKLSWNGMVSLVNKMDLVISGNTGVMHIAAALGKKQVALHGPTDPKIWGPLNPQAIVVQTKCPLCPCLKLGFEYHSKDNSCMNKIESSEIKTAIETLIKSNSTIIPQFDMDSL